MGRSTIYQNDYVPYTKEEFAQMYSETVRERQRRIKSQRHHQGFFWEEESEISEDSLVEGKPGRNSSSAPRAGIPTVRQPLSRQNLERHSGENFHHTHHRHHRCCDNAKSDGCSCCGNDNHHKHVQVRFRRDQLHPSEELHRYHTVKPHSDRALSVDGHFEGLHGSERSPPPSPLPVRKPQQQQQQQQQQPRPQAAQDGDDDYSDSIEANEPVPYSQPRVQQPEESESFDEEDEVGDYDEQPYEPQRPRYRRAPAREAPQEKVEPGPRTTSAKVREDNSHPRRSHYWGYQPKKKNDPRAKPAKKAPLHPKPFAMYGWNDDNTKYMENKKTFNVRASKEVRAHALNAGLQKGVLRPRDIPPDVEQYPASCELHHQHEKPDQRKGQSAEQRASQFVRTRSAQSRKGHVKFAPEGKAATEQERPRRNPVAKLQIRREHPGPQRNSQGRHHRHNDEGHRQANYIEIANQDAEHLEGKQRELMAKIEEGRRAQQILGQIEEEREKLYRQQLKGVWKSEYKESYKPWLNKR